jgi:hypothetical protein
MSRINASENCYLIRYISIHHKKKKILLIEKKNDYQRK